MKLILLFLSALVLLLVIALPQSETFVVREGSVDSLNARTIVVGAPIIAYGDMHVTDSSVVLPLAKDVYAHITNPTGTLFSSDISKNVAFDGDSLIIKRSGVYRISVHLSFIGAQGDIYECVVATNDIIDNDHKFTRKTSSNDVGDASFNGLYRFEANDGVKIMLRNTANNRDATIVNACLSLNRIDR